MSWVTIIWAMIASACLTLALVHVLVWWRRREALANLLFALAAVATAVFALCELWMMRVETPWSVRGWRCGGRMCRSGWARVAYRVRVVTCMARVGVLSACARLRRPAWISYGARIRDSAQYLDEAS